MEGTTSLRRTYESGVEWDQFAMFHRFTCVDLNFLGWFWLVVVAFFVGLFGLCLGFLFCLFCLVALFGLLPHE